MLITITIYCLKYRLNAAETTCRVNKWTFNFKGYKLLLLISSKLMRKYIKYKLNNLLKMCIP